MMKKEKITHDKLVKSSWESHFKVKQLVFIPESGGWPKFQDHVFYRAKPQAAKKWLNAKLIPP